MTDVEGMKKAIETCHMKEAETKNQLADLEKERQSKCDELERLKVSFSVILLDLERNHRN